MVQQLNLRSFSIILQTAHKFSAGGCKSVRTNLQTFILSCYQLSRSKHLVHPMYFLMMYIELCEYT